jgi:hypothetical protein
MITFFTGFYDELTKLGANDIIDDMFGDVKIKTPSKAPKQAPVTQPAPAPKAPPSMAWGKKKTVVPGMSQKELGDLEKKQRAPAPKVQRIDF